jgi:Xaa-Pro aminopeptidase
MTSAFNADRRIFLSRARLGMKRLGLDALMISSEQGGLYLSGYHCAGALILLSRRMKPAYFVDPMNYSLALRTLTGQPLDLILIHGDKLPAVKERIKKLGVRKLGIEEDTIPVAAYDRIKASLQGIRISPGSSVLREARLIKTPGEIRLLRKAASETMKIWRSASRKIRPGMSERRIAGMINAAIHEKGYTNSFETIVAAGPNSAYPHAVPTDKVLKKGEHLILDFGIRLDGYCSDLTRVWGEGKIVRKIGLLQKHVRFVHDKVINMIRPGVTVGVLASEADRYFEKNRLSRYVCHGLGHGVGLEVHEAPSLGSRDPGYKLKTGMLVTVEPGLYIPGVGGVRVEDMVLVTKNGCEVLTQ